jgi:hypothetical protein
MQQDAEIQYNCNNLFMLYWPYTPCLYLHQDTVLLMGLVNKT